ncbi:hypothetical protein HZS_2091, partial [Henneguya salminicola]
MSIQESSVSLPQKRFYRQRAHVNPLSTDIFEHPTSPDDIDLSVFFPHFHILDNQIEFLDIGCGYGGLLFNISEKYPDKLMMGMEIRKK